MPKSHGVQNATRINGATRQNVTLLRSGRNRHRRAQTGPKVHSISTSSPIPEAGNGSQVTNSVEDDLGVSEPYGRRHLPQRNRAASRGLTSASHHLALSTLSADNILECGPKSRGFPYASIARVTMPSVSNPPHSDTIPAQSENRTDNI